MAHSHAHHDHAHHDHGHDHGHAHGHSHGHSHGHDHAHETSVRSMRAALVLSAVFLVVEAVGGWLANSLALLADAGHLLTDVAALGLSLFVAWYSRLAASPQKS